jgi:hypothetical protein
VKLLKLGAEFALVATLASILTLKLSARSLMKRLLILMPLIVLAVNGCSSYDPVAGRVFNNVSPYIVRTDDGDLYKVTWYSGNLPHVGDEVILTNHNGPCSMIGKNGSAQVVVKEN